MKKIIGIDISKKTFDVSFQKENGKYTNNVYKNDLQGFEKLVKDVGIENSFVMEASGPYYTRIAHFLYDKGAFVSVVNPLIIRRFAQMKMFRAKTDKKDARILAQYGLEQTLKRWKPKHEILEQMRQMDSLIEGYQKILTDLTNKLEALQNTAIISEEVVKSIKHSIKGIKEEIKQLEKRLYELAKEEYPETMELLLSIPGIGPKNAIILLIITNNFTKFDNYKQLIAYVGLSPRIYESGTSVKGKGHIVKLGHSRARRLLYMASWSAKKHNKQAKALYERLKARGKPERVIKIAIANKLIKQAFAIVRSGKQYDPNHISLPYCRWEKKEKIKI